MNSGTLVLLIPVLALAIGFVAVLKMPRRAFGPRSNPQLEERLEVLEQQLGAMRKELTETQERLDFAERLLTRTEDARQLRKERS